MPKKRHRTSPTHMSAYHTERSSWSRVLRRRKMRRNSHLFAPENAWSVINTELYGTGGSAEEESAVWSFC